MADAPTKTPITSVNATIRVICPRARNWPDSLKANVHVNHGGTARTARQHCGSIAAFACGCVNWRFREPDARLARAPMTDAEEEQ
jgi:hypothetical protein